MPAVAYPSTQVLSQTWDKALAYKTGEYLADDCIDKGLDFNNSGARYRWSIINIAGIINVIDSLLVIRDTVFDNKTITATKMLELLKNNDSEFLAECRKHKNSFGRDIEEVNIFSNKALPEISLFVIIVSQLA